MCRSVLKKKCLLACGHFSSRTPASRACSESVTEGGNQNSQQVVVVHGPHSRRTCRKSIPTGKIKSIFCDDSSSRNAQQVSSSRPRPNGVTAAVRDTAVVCGVRHGKPRNSKQANMFLTPSLSRRMGAFSKFISLRMRQAKGTIVRISYHTCMVADARFT